MTTKHAQLGDRNSVRAGKAKPNRAKFARWTTKCEADEWTIVPAFDGECVSIHEVVKLLNAACVTLPGRKGRA